MIFNIRIILLGDIAFIQQFYQLYWGLVDSDKNNEEFMLYRK